MPGDRLRVHARLVRRGTAVAETQLCGGNDVNWFNLSFIGWVILIIALAIAAYMMHAPMVWIGIGALALLGIGIIVSASRSRPRI
jgi:hypothetical protein